MINLVEFAADEDEQSQSPCAHGNIVESHACYCHDDAWADGPRKCPIWHQWNVSDLSKWHRREWPKVEMLVSMESGPPIKRTYEMRASMPDDGLGGCPHFVPSSSDSVPPLATGSTEASIRAQAMEDCAVICEASAFDAIVRALDEAGIRSEVLRGMCLEVGMEKFRESLAAAIRAAKEQ